MTPRQIRTLRETLGLTQAEFAAWLGIHKVNLAQIEGGTRTVNPTLARLLVAIRDGYRPG